MPIIDDGYAMNELDKALVAMVKVLRATGFHMSPDTSEPEVWGYDPDLGMLRSNHGSGLSLDIAISMMGEVLRTLRVGA